MLDDNPLLKPNAKGKIWLFDDKYFTQYSDSFAFYIRVGSQYLFHREGGPAVYSNDSGWVEEEYHVHGNLHRDDGPAIIEHDNVPFNPLTCATKAERITEYMKLADRFYYQWFWQGEELEFLEWLKRTELPKKDRAVLLLKYR